MDIIRTGIGIGKTIRNVSRLKEILAVFAKNGFDEVFLKIKAVDAIPNFVLPKRIESSIDVSERGEKFWSVLGYRLKISFEELGPSFIKIGQVLATREDLLPPEFIEQMKKLHGNSKSMDFKVVREIIERNLNGKIEDHFIDFDPSPIGTASIGGVYKAKLKSTNENIVIKVRKPGLKKLIEGDFEILDWIIVQLEKVSEDIKVLGLRKILIEFGKGIHRELNFYQEAMSSRRIAEGFSRVEEADFIKIPKVYDEFTGEDILVMEQLKGVPFSDLNHIDQLGDKGLEKLQICVKCFIFSLMKEGFFHADLHGGNFFLLDNGDIGLIDFGLTGSLSQKNRLSLIVIFSSMFQEDFDRLASEFLDICEYQKMPEEKVLVRDIRDALAPYLGLSVQQTDIPAMFSGVFEVLASHKIMLPSEWFLIFRSIVMLDGVGQSMKVDMNFHELMKADVVEMSKDLVSFKSIKSEALWLSRDILDSARILPRHIRWFVRHLEKNDYGFELELRGVKKGFSSLSSSIEFFALSLVGVVFSALAVVLTKDVQVYHFSDISLGAWLMITLSLLSFIGAYQRLSRSDKSVD